MERPFKRRRLSGDVLDADLRDRKAQIDLRFKSNLESIFDKYGKDFNGVGDEIDIVTGEIVVNNGHILSMADEKDARYGGITSEDDDWSSESEHSSRSAYDADSLMGDPEPENEPVAGLTGKVCYNQVSIYDGEEDELASTGLEWTSPKRRIQSNLERSNPDISIWAAERNVSIDPERSITPDSSHQTSPSVAQDTPGHDTSKSSNPRSKPKSFLRWTLEEEELLRQLKTTTRLSYNEILKYFPNHKKPHMIAHWSQMAAREKAGRSLEHRALPKKYKLGKSYMAPSEDNLPKSPHSTVDAGLRESQMARQRLASPDHRPDDPALERLEDRPTGNDISHRKAWVRAIGAQTSSPNHVQTMNIQERLQGASLRISHPEKRPNTATSEICPRPIHLPSSIIAPIDASNLSVTGIMTPDPPPTRSSSQVLTKPHSHPDDACASSQQHSPATGLNSAAMASKDATNRTTGRRSSRKPTASENRLLLSRLSSLTDAPNIGELAANYKSDCIERSAHQCSNLVNCGSSLDDPIAERSIKCETSSPDDDVFSFGGTPPSAQPQTGAEPETSVASPKAADFIHKAPSPPFSMVHTKGTESTNNRKPVLERSGTQRMLKVLIPVTNVKAIPATCLERLKQPAPSAVSEEPVEICSDSESDSAYSSFIASKAQSPSKGFSPSERKNDNATKAMLQRNKTVKTTGRRKRRDIEKDESPRNDREGATVNDVIVISDDEFPTTKATQTKKSAPEPLLNDISDSEVDFRNQFVEKEARSTVLEIAESQNQASAPVVNTTTSTSSSIRSADCHLDKVVSPIIEIADSQPSDNIPLEDPPSTRIRTNTSKSTNGYTISSITAEMLDCGEDELSYM